VINYVITFARSAEKELAALPVTVVLRARAAIDALAVNPKPTGCKKLKNARTRWRVRVGDYRVVYTISDKQRLVDIEAVRHRRLVYRSN
jgi:mRNA interferase RelE/StbE